MTATLTAVYRGGTFHPTTPPDLPDGATVQLTVVADPAPPPAEPSPEGKSPGERAYDIIRAITARSARPGPPDPVAAEHDRYLYGEEGDRGDVR